MAQQLGPSGFLSNSSKRENKSTYTSRGNSSIIISVRVRDIILDDTHPRFLEFGGWNGIGTIFFETVPIPDLTPIIDETTAYPLFPNIKHYPLKEEIVTLLRASDVNSEGNTTSVSWYYFPPVNIWNSQVHNALPLTINPIDEADDYVRSDAGFVRRVTDQSTEINLGETFNENNVIDIHPLLPYEGDIIYEGRFGNSIRLGSTVDNANIANYWSAAGENGSPITIIRNGQPDNPVPPPPITDTNSWVPIVENINLDKSSIYLTSTQQIPLLLSSNREDSYRKSTPPEAARTYSGNQILLNSGRLVFNAKNDSIILSAEKSIHLTSDTSVNVDAGTQIALAAPKVYLGSTTGTEGIELQSVVKGENLNTVLGDIAVFLETLNVAFQTATDSVGAPILSLSTIACDAELLGKTIKNIVNGKDLLSKQVKTV